MDLKTHTTRPPVNVSAKAVICRGASTLLLRRANGRWDLPGGKARPGEGATETLHREVLEETGLTLRSASLLGVHRRTLPSGQTCHTLSFYCQTLAELSDTPIVLSDEHVAFAFMGFEQIGMLRLRTRHKKAIYDAHQILRSPVAA